MLKIGNDIVDIKKFTRVYTKHKDKLLNRVFTKEEIDYCLSKKYPIIHLSGKFAAKEAVKKAVEGKSIYLKDIMIVNKRNGAPIAKLKSCNLNDIDIQVSVSHTNSYATAVAIANII